MKKKTIYGVKIRIDDTKHWGPTEWFASKKKRDESASFSRIMGGFRTYSFEEKKTIDEINELLTN